MESSTYYLVYSLYILASSCLAYPLLKRKTQQPQKLEQFIAMLFFNALFLGVLPLITFLIKHPPKPPVSRADSYDYYEKKRIWIWNK